MVSAFCHSASIGRCFGHAGHYHCLECEEANTLTQDRPKKGAMIFMYSNV
jgi:hypothetical protein